MGTISLCMIVKNEEKLLPQCLGSVKGIVSEMVIVDTGSQDRTMEIARENGAKVHQYEWDGNTAKARNSGLRKATGEWILVLDADETIAREDLGKVAGLAERKDADAFIFIQRNYTTNPYLFNFVPCEGDPYQESAGFPGYVRVPVVRMFRNIETIFYEREAHELVEYSIQRFGHRAAEAGIPIHHFKELKGEEARRAAIAHYARLSEEIARKRPDPKAYFDMALDHFRRKEYGKAAECYARAIELAPGWIEAYVGLSEALVSQGNLWGAYQANRKITQLDPRFPAAYYNLGELCLGLGRYQEAVEMYTKALGLGFHLKERIREAIQLAESQLSKKA